MDEAQMALLIPMVFFSMVAIIAWGFFYFRNRGRTELQATIRQALDKGQELSPELIDRISEPKPGKMRDLKRGLIWVAVAIGFVGLGFTIPDAEARPVMLGFSVFPVAVGLAYILIWKLTPVDD
jgi:Na+/H+ antiporter NhaD/arsenite permease-like protein